jgi:hypothetical protein
MPSIIEDIEYHIYTIAHALLPCVYCSIVEQTVSRTRAYVPSKYPTNHQSRIYKDREMRAAGHSHSRANSTSHQYETLKSGTQSR